MLVYSCTIVCDAGLAVNHRWVIKCVFLGYWYFLYLLRCTSEVTESAKPLCGVRCRLAIGAVLAGILLIVLVSLLVWRLHRKRKQASLNDVEKFVGSSVSLSALPTGIVDTQCQARSSRWFLPPHSTIVNTGNFISWENWWREYNPVLEMFVPPWLGAAPLSTSFIE